MPITEKQRAERRRHGYSTDVPALFGVDPWQTAYDVWARKTGRIPDEPETEIKRSGRLMEAAILGYAGEELGPLLRNQHRTAPDLHLGAHIDALVRETGEPVEGKKIGRRSLESWGEPGTDEVPDRVVIQCHVQMICCGNVDVAWVPVHHYDHEFAMYRLALDGDLVNEIIERVAAFWRHVEKDTPPPDSPSIGVARRLRRTKGAVIALPMRLWEQREATELRLAIARAEKEQADAALLARMGEAEYGDLGDGRVVTFLEQTRKAYNVSASTYRVLRLTTKEKLCLPEPTT